MDLVGLAVLKADLAAGLVLEIIVKHQVPDLPVIMVPPIGLAVTEEVMAITEVTITARIIVLLTMSAVMILIGGTSKKSLSPFLFSLLPLLLSVHVNSKYM